MSEDEIKSSYSQQSSKDIATEKSIQIAATPSGTQIQSGPASQRTVTEFSENTDKRSNVSRKRKNPKSKKKKSESKKCVGEMKWDCENELLWRIYMKTFADNVTKRKEAEIERYGEIQQKRREQAHILPVPDVVTSTMDVLPPCELNVFNLRGAGFTNARIWENMKDPCLYIDSAVFGNASGEIEWPRLWPCFKGDPIRDQKILSRKLEAKKMGATPCEVEEIDSPDSSDEERLQELANLKELVHARIPVTAPKKPEVFLVDRAAGENSGLVNGDYIIFELCSKRGNRTYANVCLRGLTGMHLVELGRCRIKTWKFCLFQALVALLAKTQLRYKYAWSANVDYIYQHAWLIFLHIGFLNVKRNQRFDDVLVYNYKYNVELELIQELKDVPVVTNASFNFFEKSLQKQRKKSRRELTLIQSSLGSEKTKDDFNLPVHKGTRMIEKWFDELDDQFTNCIIRTSRFALAFWQDGSFWYLYNPYRCDRYGFWNDSGYACIMKFCSRDSLKRHLMVSIVRAYAYRPPEKKPIDEDDKSRSYNKAKNTFTIQIYQLIHHSCKIHNVKLYHRSPYKPRPALVEKKESDPCTFDPHAHLAPIPCEDSLKEDEKSEEFDDKMEKSIWIRDKKITWSKRSIGKENEEENQERPKWHEYEVIEPRLLYVLWGEMHITDLIFPQENRNKQAGACYAVCAGMSLVNAPEYWNSETLNAIVVCGDKYYSQRIEKIRKISNSIKLSKDDEWDILPSDTFKVAETHFEFKAFPAIEGRLFVRDDKSLWQSLESLLQHHRFAILYCESTRLGVFKHNGAYYILDVRSYGRPIFESGNGMAYILRVSCFPDFIRSLILLIGSPECSRFALRPIEIVKIVDINDPCRRRICKEDKCGKNFNAFKAACPLEDERKKARKKKGRLAIEEIKKNVDKIVCTQKDD